MKHSIGRLLSILLVLIGGGLTKAQDAPQAGTIREDEHGIEQVYVPAGCFLMGTSEAEADYALSLEAPDWVSRRLPSEQPQHEVCLTKGYWIDRTEVTNASFQAFVEAGGYSQREWWSAQGLRWLDRQKSDSLPVVCQETAPEMPRTCITWYEAEAYAAWRGGALPTEAQWEYAARSPESFIYPWGNEWDANRANVVESEGLVAVDSYPDGLSWVGASDMAGNAMEWVADWLSSNYSVLLTQTEDPTGMPRGNFKIEKGGWWGSNPVVARAAYRHFEDPPTYQDHHIGVRIVSPADF